MSNGLAKLLGNKPKMLDFTHSEVEYGLLDEFHEAWSTFHRLANMQADREDLQGASQNLIDAHQAILNYRKRQH